MIDQHINTIYAHQRQQDALRDAEQYRLAGEVGNPADHQPFYAPLLTSIGHRLIDLGENLQARYGQPVAPLELGQRDVRTAK